MITARGYWFLVLVLAVLTLGAFDGRSALTVSMLTLLLWFLSQWLLFVVRVHWVVPRLRIRRVLLDQRGPVATLWAGQSFRVRTEIRLAHWLGIPFARIKDFMPFGVEKTDGENSALATVSAEKPVALTYKIRCPAAGWVRFEGLAVEIADFAGFFYVSTFIPRVAVYRVLPPLADAAGHRPSVKRRNLLPATGLHRHLRPGTGSELLDLRDYMTGDPPKTIAWKVSARRDRLITKEFESEVPMRCTLFVDTSQSVRVGGPGQNALARIVEVSASVTQAMAGIRDYAGLCLFNEEKIDRYIRPGRGPRHVAEILNILADTAGLAAATGPARLPVLLPTALAFIQEVYPELVRPEINSVPGWLSWFWPAAAMERRRFRFARIVARWLFVAVLYLPFAVLGAGVYFIGEDIYPFLSDLLRLPPFLLALVGAGLLASGMILYYPLVRLANVAIGRLLSPRRRHFQRWRKSVAAVIAGHYGLGPGGLGLLLGDNQCLVLWTERFLADHHVPYTVPLYDWRGEYLYSSPGKINVLADALLRAIKRVRDNELFVLLVDLLELVDQLEPLLRAVKVTLARHHRVLVICPWPPGIAPPVGKAAERGGKPFSLASDLSTGVEQVTAARLNRAYMRLRRSFSKMGVQVVCAASGDPARLILARINQLRSVGMGRR
jgi:uncharacterized protein (DUF58 family)